MGGRKQDKQTQKLFDNVTKSLRGRDDGIVRDDNGRIVAEVPLKEEHPIGSLLLLRGAGPAAAKSLEFIGEKMMPSALLKGVGQTFPKVAKATTALSPYADAGLLATGGAQGIREAKEAAKSGDAAGAIAGVSMAALPLMGINPEVAQELTATQKANKVARALNREVKPLSRPISEAEKLGVPKGERSNLQGYQGWLKGDDALNSNKFASEVRLGDGDYSDAFIDDATTIAQSIMSPGKMSNEAISGINRMKSAFQSDGMKSRLRNIGYTEDEINSYINNRLAGLDLSKTSVAENLSAIRPLEARTNGSITIKPGVEVGYGQNYNGLGIEPFDQQFIQITKDGNVKDIISHEVGGHGTENFDFSHDKSGNQLYSETKLTNLGKSVAKNTGLGESYYLDPKEQRARFIVTAQDMSEQGLNPNSYPDFVKFIVKNQNAPMSTNTGQTAKFYDIRTLWPAFSKAHSILPIAVGIGLGGAALSKQKQGGILKAQKGTPNNGLPSWIKRDDSTRTYITAFKPGDKDGRTLLRNGQRGDGKQLIRDSSLVKRIGNDGRYVYIPRSLTGGMNGGFHISEFTGENKDSDEFIGRLRFIGMTEDGLYEYYDPLTGQNELYDTQFENGGKIHIKSK